MENSYLRNTQKEQELMSSIKPLKKSSRELAKNLRERSRSKNKDATSQIKKAESPKRKPSVETRNRKTEISVNKSSSHRSVSRSRDPKSKNTKPELVADKKKSSSVRHSRSDDSKNIIKTKSTKITSDKRLRNGVVSDNSTSKKKIDSKSSRSKPVIKDTSKKDASRSKDKHVDSSKSKYQLPTYSSRAQENNRKSNGDDKKSRKTSRERISSRSSEKKSTIKDSEKYRKSSRSVTDRVTTTKHSTKQKVNSAKILATSEKKLEIPPENHTEIINNDHDSPNEVIEELNEDSVNENINPDSGGDEYNYDEEEFEDYDSDFEEESVADDSESDPSDQIDSDADNVSEKSDVNDGEEQALNNLSQPTFENTLGPESPAKSPVDVNQDAMDQVLSENYPPKESEEDHTRSDNESYDAQKEVLNDSAAENDTEHEAASEKFSPPPSPEKPSLLIKFDEGKENEDQQNSEISERKSSANKGIISFTNAEKKEKRNRAESKIRSRANEILELVSLDENYFDLFELSPVNYESYIKNFGRMNSRQVYVQTDQKVDDESQTNEVEVTEKWTQCPAHDFKGFGGDTENDDKSCMTSWEFQTKIDILRLTKFLQSVEPVMMTLLKEASKDTYMQKLQNNQANISFSDGYVQLTPPIFRKDSPVTYVHFSHTQENIMLSIHATSPSASEADPVADKGIICVWNLFSPSEPEKILMCSSQPICACFSPLKCNVAFAGMVDGSVAVWDLCESSLIHRTETINDENFNVRAPSYSTAEVLREDGHLSAIVSVQSILYSKQRTKDSGDKNKAESGSYEIVTLEENGIVKFWFVVSEAIGEETLDSVVDLGLAPQSKLKLILRSTVNLQETPTIDDQLKFGLKTLDLQINASNPNRMYITTDAGNIIHYFKQGSTAVTKLYSSEGGIPCNVQSIDFSPHNLPYFLVGCADGSVMIYCTRKSQPLMDWSGITGGVPILKVKWSTSRPSIFYVLDVSSRIYVWDLSNDIGNPTESCQFTQGRVLNFDLCIDFGHTIVGNPVMALAMDDSTIEIHRIADKFSSVPEERFHELSISVTSL